MISLAKNWSIKLLEKNKASFILFFIKFKKQIMLNKELKNILIKYSKTKKINKEEALLIRTIVIDNLKMVGIGSLCIIPIPGSTFIIIFLINSAKKIGVNFTPSQFENDIDK